MIDAFLPSLKKSRKRFLNIVLLYLFPFIVWHGYNYIGFDASLMKMLIFVAIPILTIYVISELLQTQNVTPIFKIVRLLFFLILFSIFFSFVFWDQPILFGYRVTAEFLSIIFYFFLRKAHFSRKELETYLVINAFLWIFLWLYAFSQAPSLIFAVDEDAGIEERGIFRLNIPGAVVVNMVFFLYVNKFLNKRRIVYLLLAIFFYFFIIVQLSRQIILFTIIVAFLFILRKIRFKLIFLICILMSFSLIKGVLSDNEIVGALIDLTERQYEDSGNGTEYIRVKENDYFFTQYTQNPLAVIIGNGIPHSETSYGRYYEKITNTYNYYYSDAGYAEIYIFFGIIGLVLVFMLIYKTCRYEIRDKRFLWLQMFIIFMALYNLMSGAIIAHFIELSIILYLYEDVEFGNTANNHQRSYLDK